MKNCFYIIIFLLISGIHTIVAQNPGDTLFASPDIHNINITFTQPNFFDSLMYYKQHADSLNLSTQKMMGNFYIDGTLIDSVGISLKGNSSFGYPGRKKSIKITFNQYVAGKKLEGLTLLDLNNNTLDPTMMREKLMLDFMNKKKLPAPRCTYAKVSYNGQYVGLYKMIEQVDKEFIITRYKNWGGNLFKGDPQGTLNWINNQDSSYYPYYELHSNTITNNWSDLVNFIDNINNTPAANFFDTLETNLNTFPCIGQWAARNLFVDLDGYFHAPHNYYLYHNTVTNKFEWNTWDVSVSFGFYPMMSEDSTEHTSLLMAYNPLVQKMLANNNYKTTYLNTICDYLDYLDTTVISPIIDSIANKIYPAFAAEPDSNQMFPEQALFWTCDTMTIHTPIGDIPALKKFITNRRNNVINQLASLPFTCANAVNDLSSANFNIEIYPNPASGVFWVSIPSGQITSDKLRMTNVSIYNLLGEIVLNLPINQSTNQRINLSDKPSGIYFCVLKAGEAVATRKIIINK